MIIIYRISQDICWLSLLTISKPIEVCAVCIVVLSCGGYGACYTSTYTRQALQQSKLHFKENGPIEVRMFIYTYARTHARTHTNTHINTHTHTWYSKILLICLRVEVSKLCEVSKKNLAICLRVEGKGLSACLKAYVTVTDGRQRATSMP